MKKLSELSDKELNAQLSEMTAEAQRRAELERKRIAEERWKFNDAIFEARRKLLPFMQHERTSCSDENPSNAYSTQGRDGRPRCQKCFLQNLQLSDLQNVEFSLEGRYLADHAAFEG